MATEKNQISETLVPVSFCAQAQVREYGCRACALCLCSLTFFLTFSAWMKTILFDRSYRRRRFCLLQRFFLSRRGNFVRCIDLWHVWSICDHLLVNLWSVAVDKSLLLLAKLARNLRLFVAKLLLTKVCYCWQDWQRICLSSTLTSSKSFLRQKFIHEDIWPESYFKRSDFLSKGRI